MSRHSRLGGSGPPSRDQQYLLFTHRNFMGLLPQGLGSQPGPPPWGHVLNQKDTERPGVPHVSPWQWDHHSPAPPASRCLLSTFTTSC